MEEIGIKIPQVQVPVVFVLADCTVILNKAHHYLGECRRQSTNN